MNMIMSYPPFVTYALRISIHDSVLLGVDEKSKGVRVDEKSNDDRTPHDHSKLHNAVESCHHYSSHQHEPPYSSHRYRMFGTLSDGTVMDGKWSAKGLLEFRLLHNILS